MYRMNMSGTKWDIFQKALDLFSKNGFNYVSMGQLASAVGIRPSSIYNHFSGKDALLEQIYRYYSYYSDMFLPGIDDMLEMLRERPASEAFMRMLYFFPDEIQDNMDKSLNIITAMTNDERARKIIRHYFFDIPQRYSSPILEYMLEQGQVEPLNIGTFATVYSCMCHSAALQTLTTSPVSKETWIRANGLLFGCVKERAI